MESEQIQVLTGILEVAAPPVKGGRRVYKHCSELLFISDVNQSPFNYSLLQCLNVCGCIQRPRDKIFCPAFFSVLASFAGEVQMSPGMNCELSSLISACFSP